MEPLTLTWHAVRFRSSVLRTTLAPFRRFFEPDAKWIEASLG